MNRRLDNDRTIRAPRGSEISAKSWLTVAFPSAWLYFLGGLFILVTLLTPQGLIGLRAVVGRLKVKR